METLFSQTGRGGGTFALNDLGASVLSDRDLSDGALLQSSQQALLRGGGELQVRAAVPAEPAGRPGQVQGQTSSDGVPGWASPALTSVSAPQYKADTLKKRQNLSEEHPVIDYTPPSLITLLFTDLGVLTPSAVSDELIKLYL